MGFNGKDALEDRKKLVLKITSSTWENASRDMRELATARECGAEVLVMAKGEKTGVVEQTGGFPVYRMNTKPLGQRIPSILNRCMAMITWARKARGFRPDIISGHDLIPLLIGWLSTLFMSKRHKPELIYDSHEFTIYDGKKSKLNQFLVRKLEHFLIKKCCLVIEVNDSIAKQVQKIHQLKKTPLVIRNIPSLWKLDENEILKIRKKMTQKLHAAEDVFLVLYHGGITKGRGIEILLQAVARNSGICAVILGNGTDAYVTELKQKADALGVMQRVLFHPAVPIEELYKYAGAADVGFVCIEAACKSLYYSLPNKFFENIQALTPIICSNFPEMSALNEKYRVGITVDPVDASRIDNAILKLKEDRLFYQQCKENCALAKEELCWEKERQKLAEAYQMLLKS